MGLNHFPLQVDCYSGHIVDETPRRFDWQGEAVEVGEIVTRWQEPDYRYFKVRGKNGCLYLLAHNRMSQKWSLIIKKKSSDA